MMAIAWDSSDNEFTPATNSQWYNYVEEEGNADGKTSRWANAKDANGNMFVWIPRYSYKITYYNEQTYSTLSLRKCKNAIWKNRCKV